MELVNLTPHNIDFTYDADGGEKVGIPASGVVARVAQAGQTVGSHHGFPITVYAYGEVMGLPEPRENVWYLVSGMVLAAVPHRADVFAPDSNLSVRDFNGRIVGTRGFSCTPAYVEQIGRENA